MAEETKDVDVLEQVKKIDKAVKAKMLIEKIALLKQLAREMNELKEKSVATLEELGLSDKDMKRIIDYINELPEVKLSERDKKNIRDEIHNNVAEEKEEVEDLLRKVDIDKLIGATTTTLGYNGTGLPHNSTYYCSGTTDLTPNANTLWMSVANGDNFVATIGDVGNQLSIKL